MKRGGGSPKSRLEMRRKWAANQMKPSLSKDDPEACGEFEEETAVLSPPSALPIMITRTRKRFTAELSTGGLNQLERSILMEIDQ